MQANYTSILSTISSMQSNNASKEIAKPKVSATDKSSFKDALKSKEADRAREKDKIDKKDGPTRKKDKSKKVKSDEVSDSDDKLKDLKEAVKELKSIIEEALMLINMDSEESAQLESALTELKDILESIKLGDEVKISESIEKLDSLLAKMTADGKIDDVTNINSDLLEVARLMKKAKKVMKNLDKSVDFKTLINQESQESKGIVKADSISNNQMESDTGETDDNDDSKETVSHLTKSKSMSKQSLSSNAVKIVNKLNVNDAYGSNEQLDIENFDIVNGSSVKVTGVNALSKLSNINTVTGKEFTEIVDQITQEISLNVNEEVSEMMLKLRPDHMGKMAMKIVIDRGIMVANFEVESQIVKEAIEANLDDLKSSLEDKGLDVSEFNVSVNKDDSSQQEMSRFFNNSRRRNMTKMLEEDITDQENKGNTYVSAGVTQSLYSTVDFLA